MENYNIDLFNAINSLTGYSDLLNVIMAIYADYSPYLFIILLIWLFFRRDDESRTAALHAGYAATLGTVMNFIISSCYFHSRPFMIPIGRMLVPHKPEGSFPSDHATFLLSIAFMLTIHKKTRKLGIVAILMALFCGFARVFCGVHFPFDILGSIVVAAVAACSIYIFRNRLESLTGFLLNFRQYVNNKEASYRKPILWCLGLVALLWVIIAYAFPLVDPSEGRYANIALYMARSGDFITPYILQNGEWSPFLGKPPLYFWIAALSIQSQGATEFAVRFPNVIASILLLSVIFFIIRRYHDEQTAYLSVLITATSGLFFIGTTTVLVDIMLMCFSISAFYLYYGFIREESKAGKKFLSISVFICLGLAFLVKGPVGLVLFGLPVFLWTLFNKRWNTLRYHAWVTGLTLFSLITVPWFYLSSRVHPGFLEYFFVNENFKRFTSSEYGDKYGTGHQYFHGMSALFFAGGAEPWLLLLTGVIIYHCIKLAKKERKGYLISLIQEKDDESAPAVSYFFLGFFSIVIFWCLAKQLHFYYLITVIPPFATWCVIIFRRHNVSLKWITMLALLSLCVYGIIFTVIPFAAGKKVARPVITEIRANKDFRPENAKIIFMGGKNPSAYFYAPDELVIHPKEGIGTTWNRNADFYVLKTRDFEKFQKGNKYTLISKNRTWTVLKHKEKN